jgi:hypothetical protein
MSKLTPADVTPERIVAIVRARGLRLMWGKYIHWDEADNPVGCCPAGALAIEAEPEILRHDRGRKKGVMDAFVAIGLSLEFRIGLIRGFEGSRMLDGFGADHDHGYSVGRDVRRLAQLDAGGPPA